MAKSSGSTYATIEQRLVALFYIMYGQDNFSLSGELKKIKRGLGNPEMLAINTNVLDGRQLSLGQLNNACNAMPFMHPNRLVIVEGLLERFEPKKKSGNRTSKPQAKLGAELKEWQELGTYAKKMPTTTVLVLIDGELNAMKNALFKHISSSAEVKGFPQLNKTALHSWIKKTISEKGGKASDEAINLLEKLVGGDLWAMGHEIEKLIAFSHGRLVVEEDVIQVTSYTRDVNIFALVDAILEHHMKDGQQFLHRLLLDGNAPPYILSMITRQLRLILLAKELNNKVSEKEAMKKLGISKDFVLDKLLKQSKIHTIESIKRAYHEVLEADMAMKTGGYDDELAIELMVMDLCQR